MVQSQTQGPPIAISVPKPQPNRKPMGRVKEESAKERTQDSGDDLERLCKEEWSKIPLSVFSNLVKCYRRRLSAVLLAKGGVVQSINNMGANNCGTND